MVQQQDLHLKMLVFSVHRENIPTNLQQLVVPRVWLTDMLKTQSSLAGLQGVMKRCKDSVKEFDEMCSSRLESLDPFVDQEPRQLVESNSRFISTCLTYEDEDKEHAYDWVLHHHHRYA